MSGIVPSPWGPMWRRKCPPRATTAVRWPRDPGAVETVLGSLDPVVPEGQSDPAAALPLLPGRLAQHCSPTTSPSHRRQHAGPAQARRGDGSAPGRQRCSRSTSAAEELFRRHSPDLDSGRAAGQREKRSGGVRRTALLAVAEKVGVQQHPRTVRLLEVGGRHPHPRRRPTVRSAHGRRSDPISDSYAVTGYAAGASAVTV